MTNNIHILPTGEKQFIPIPATVQLAILLPTVRWNRMAQSVIASLVGVANEEVAVLIADNSENTEKREFLKQICAMNSYILVVSHEKNIGAFANMIFFYKNNIKTYKRMLKSRHETIIVCQKNRCELSDSLESLQSGFDTERQKTTDWNHCCR